MADSDKPHTFTPWQIESGNQKSEEDWQGNHCIYGIQIMLFITSLVKGGYVFGSVALSVCLSVCGQRYSKSYEWVGMKFYGKWSGGLVEEGRGPVIVQ